MNVPPVKKLVSISVVPSRSESMRRMFSKPFLIIGTPIIRSSDMCENCTSIGQTNLAFYAAVESLIGRNVGVLNMVVLTTLMEAVVGLGNSPCEVTTESQPELSSAVGSLVCNKLTKEKQLLDNSRSLKWSIAALPFMIVGEARAGEATATREVLLEKRGELCN